MSLLGKYEYIIDKSHPRANKEGSVYVHFIVAEQVMGRPLLPGEFVHHKDCNKHNNAPENIMVFASNGDHSRFHSYHLNESLLSKNENGAYVCQERYEYCIDCGAKISRCGTRCIACGQIFQRKVARPDAHELLSLLRTLYGNFTRVGKIYGVTDNTVRKWCRKYSLPSHSKDYQK
jgi:hypothetical protein